MSEEGKLFDYANLDAVDDFSRTFYEDLREWSLAQEHGTWSTWSGAPYGHADYLLLEIVVVRDGEQSALVNLYSADEEVTFATRVWEDHGPHWGSPETSAASYAMQLAERWFAGEFLIAVYYEHDAWKGSVTIARDSDLQAALTKGLAWVRERFDATRVELTGPYKSADRVFAIGAQGIEFPV